MKICGKILLFLATGGWPERENVYNVRLTEIIEWYKSVVLLEKQQKLEKDKKKQRKYMSFTVSFYYIKPDFLK